MAEELANVEAGAVPEGTGGPTGEPIADARQDVAAEAGTEQAAQRVDLTQLPDFREWQSKMDRRVAEATRQATEAQQRAEEAERRAADRERQQRLAEMQDGDPAEIVRYYEEERQRLLADMQRKEQEQAKAKQIDAEVMGYLERVGLSPDTPGLDFSGGRTPEGVQRLYASAGEVLALRTREVTKTKATEIEAAAREAKRQTLVQSGGARVSSVPGGGSTALLAEFEAKMQRVRGDVGAIVALEREYRSRGLDV